MTSDKLSEGRASVFCSRIGYLLYARLGSELVRSRLRKLIVWCEGGPAYSRTIRRIFRDFYKVNVGLYTADPCRVKPLVFHMGTTIGRYTFIADSVRTFTRNHPMNTKSTHGVFYNASLGLAKASPLQFGSLTIGNGVYIGHNAIILPPTAQIGDGAIVMPGAVVCTNVPPYAIVAGFPAHVTGYRYTKPIIADLLKSRWWEQSPTELDANSGVLRQIWDRTESNAAGC
jgi:acetyltransferase-like isoleucine patch superfamily enzyme